MLKRRFLSLWNLLNLQHLWTLSYIFDLPLVVFLSCSFLGISTSLFLSIFVGICILIYLILMYHNIYYIENFICNIYQIYMNQYSFSICYILKITYAFNFIYNIHIYLLDKHEIVIYTYMPHVYFIYIYIYINFKLPVTL